MLLASSGAPHRRNCGSHGTHPRRSPTATLTAPLSGYRPHAITGRTSSQSPLYVDDAHPHAVLCDSVRWSYTSIRQILPWSSTWPRYSDFRRRVLPTFPGDGDWPGTWESICSWSWRVPERNHCTKNKFVVQWYGLVYPYIGHTHIASFKHIRIHSSFVHTMFQLICAQNVWHISHLWSFIDLMDGLTVTIRKSHSLRTKTNLGLLHKISVFMSSAYVPFVYRMRWGYWRLALRLALQLGLKTLCVERDIYLFTSQSTIESEQQKNGHALNRRNCN